MTPIDFHARLQATEQGIVVDSRLEGQPPRHHERAWSSIEAWGMGRPDATYSEGVYLLLRESPHGDFLWLRAQGVADVVGALRRRLPERSAGEIQAEIDRRSLAQLELEARALFGTGEWPRVQELLQGDAVLRTPAVPRAVVRLSRGDVVRLEEMVRAARVDPRDVLLWAQMEGLG
jgi:hypothetical protein